MASIDASTSGAGGIITTADNTGTLNLQSGGTTIATINSTGLSMASGKVLAPTGPAFSAYISSTNQVLGSGTWTKIALNAEEFDTNNNFDTTNYRFTPTVAGYYMISAVGWVNSPGTNPSYVTTAIYKNGTAIKQADLYGGANVNGAVTVTSVIYLNGSTDYIEFYMYAAGGNAGQYTYAGSANTYMSGFLARSA